MSAATTIPAPETTTTDLLAPATTGLEPTSAEQLRSLFVPFLDRAQEWERRAKAIVVTSEDDSRSMKFARESRLALREIRVGVEHARKSAKADALSRGKAVDGLANAIKGLIEPLEAHLLEQETFADRAEGKRRDALRNARREALVALGTDPSLFSDLGAMSEEAWSALLDNSKLAHEAKVQAAKDAESIRVAAERLAAEARAAEKAAAIQAEAARVERERLQKEENARLQAEKAQLEEAHRLEREKAAAEKMAAVAEEMRQAAERDRVAKAERERVEAERAAERAEAKAREDEAREDADRAARELAAEREAAAKAQSERDAEDAARAAAEADARKPTKARYALLVEALTKIAAWGQDIESCDEPHAATRARDALNAVGLGR